MVVITMSDPITIVTAIVRETFEAFGTTGDYEDIAKKVIDKKMSYSEVLGLIRDKVSITEKETKTEDIIVSSIIEEGKKEKKVRVEDDVTVAPKVERTLVKSESNVSTGEKSDGTEGGELIEMCASDDVIEIGELKTEGTKVESTKSPEVVSPIKVSKIEAVDKKGKKKAKETPNDLPAEKEGELLTKEMFKDKFDDEVMGYIVEFSKYTETFTDKKQFEAFVKAYKDILPKITIGKLEKRNFIAAVAFACLKSVLKTTEPTQRAYYEPKNVEFRSLCRSYLKIRGLGLSW